MKIMNKRNRTYLFILGVLLGGSCLIQGCKSDSEAFVDDPYAGGREPLEVGLSMDEPSPSRAYPKDKVKFQTKGLAKYIHKDPVTNTETYDFTFYISDSKVEKIVEASDTTVTVVVPDNVSSGTVYMELNDQVFYGPKLTVLGSVSVDEGFALLKNKRFFYNTTTWGVVCYDAMPRWNNPETGTMQFYLVGDFTYYAVTNPFDKNEHGNFGGIGLMTSMGNMINYKLEGYRVRYGGAFLTLSEWIEDNVRINSLNYLQRKDEEGPMMLISGSFSRYETDKAIGTNYMNTNTTSTYSKLIKNILILRNDSRQPIVTQSLRTTSGGMQDVQVPEFNGGTNGPIARSFVTSDDQIIAVGNFDEYSRINYSECVLYGKETNQMIVESTEGVPAHSVIKMKSTPEAVAEWGNSFSGALDETYRSGDSYTGTTGYVVDACMNAEDEVIIVGEFSSFDGTAVSNIVKLDAQGNVDQDFLNAAGSGANGRISTIRYDKETDRALITGNFTTFNGKVCQGLVMIDSDGNIDETFDVFGKFDGGFPTYAEAVNINGLKKVIVSGNFMKYDKITRKGFLLLNADGTPEQRFNVPGQFGGQLYKVLYSRTSEDNNGLLLLGDFYMFDDRRAYNSMMLEVNIEE